MKRPNKTSHDGGQIRTTCKNGFIHAGLALGLAAALAGCKQETSVRAAPPTEVRVETIKESDYARVVRLTGEIRAQTESDLSFRAAGRVAERLVNVGDHVSAGQVLARLDPTQQLATVAAAEATVRAAEAVLRQATSTFDRQKALLASGYTTKRDYDQAEEAYRTSGAAVTAARAQLGTARDQLNDTALRGVAGVITARKTETGQVVQVAQTVFTIAQDGPRDAVFGVHETIFTHGPAEAVIDLALVNDPSVRATGRVREISPTVDPSNGTVRAKVAIDVPPAGMSLGASVIGAGRFQSRKVISIPWSALSSDGGVPAVWIVDPRTRTVALKKISIQSYEARQVVVGEGLQSGELIVTDGAQFLRPQQVVSFSEGATL